MRSKKKTESQRPVLTTTLVEIRPNTLVLHNGEQVGGTLEGVDPELALSWLRRGWAKWVAIPPESPSA